MEQEQRQAAKRQMLELMQVGQPWQAAAAAAGIQVSRSTAYRWLKDVCTRGEAALQDGRHGHPAKVRPPVLQWLELRCQGGSQVPSSQLQRELQEQLGVVTGRHRAYGYCHTERFLSQLAKAKGSEALTTALGCWTSHLWEVGSQDAGEETAPCLYIDGHRKPVYADCLIPRGLIGRTGKILGGRALVLLHDEQGHPRLVTTSRGDQHLTVGLPKALACYEQAGGKTAHARIIVDRDQMAAPFLRDLSRAGHSIVTLLKTNQYDGLTSFTELGEFVPLTYDRKSQVIREVAPACFELPLPDQKDQVLPRPRGSHP